MLRFFTTKPVITAETVSLSRAKDLTLALRYFTTCPNETGQAGVQYDTALGFLSFHFVSPPEVDLATQNNNVL